MLAKKWLFVGIFTLLILSLAIADPPAVHPTTGEPLVIDCLRGTPDAIDGDLSDWNLEAMTPAVLVTQEQLNEGQANWDGPEDCSGEFYLLWDDENIYMAVVVKDDKLSQNKTGDSIWNADGIEVFFSTTNAVGGDDEHYQYGFDFKEQRWNWCNMEGPGFNNVEPDYLQIASSETADGYICEASIEYGQMLSLDFAVGSAIGFHPVIDDTDNGDREIQMTWTSRAAHDQSLGFGHIVLSADPAIAAELSNKPSPANGAEDVPRDVVLSWEPGKFAAPTNGHKVYFGESFNDVNDATGGGAQNANSYTPAQRLDLGTTYYWRVDEVNAPPTSHIEFKGGVWSFTTEPIGCPVPSENITATASSAHLADMGPENTINGLGLDADDLHSIETVDMWLSSDEPNGAWIEYELDKVYKLHQMWVWNHNGMMESFLGFGLKDVTIEYSTNGTDYTTLGTTHEFAQAPGTPDYAHNTTVDFGGATAKYVRLTANGNWGGMLNQYGLSEVRFFHIPVHAREPSPDSGTTDVAVDVTLGFRAGREGAEHHLYFNSDEQAVIDGNVPVSTVTETSYGPLSLDLGTTYYWKINEVNMAETPTMLEGDIWNFTTHDSLVVEDFESYNDIAAGEEGSNLVYSTWIDGYVNPLANGSTIGYVEAFQPSMETAIVHGGDQSVPLMYNNSVAAYSEATANIANLAIGGNWALHGIKSLSLWFYGDPNNALEQMYVRLNGVKKVLYDGDAGNITKSLWQPWNINMADFAGVDLSNVTELSIGFERIGLFGGSGTVLFDDIRLYSYSRQLITPVQPDPAGLVGHWEFDGNYDDSSGNGRNGTPVGAISFEADPARGQVLSLPGGDDQFVDLGSVGISGNMPRTIACWAKADNTSIPDWTLIFGFTGDATGGGGDGSHFNIGSLGPPGGVGAHCWGWEETIFSDQVALDWHHYAMTYDGTTIQYYGDGILMDTDTGNSNVWDLSASADRVHVGSRITQTSSFPGKVDDAKIFNRVLSDVEIVWLAGWTLPFDKPF